MPGMMSDLIIESSNDRSLIEVETWMQSISNRREFCWISLDNLWTTIEIDLLIDIVKDQIIIKFLIEPKLSL